MSQSEIHKPSPKTIWKVIFVVWLVIGTAVLICGDISRSIYGCALFAILIEASAIIKLIKEDKNRMSEVQLTDEVLEQMICIQEEIAVDAFKEEHTKYTFENRLLSALRELKEYRDICPTPEKLKEVDRLYLDKCREVDGLKKWMINDIKKYIESFNAKHNDYMAGIRNGLRLCLVLLGIEPEFEKCNPWIPASEIPEDMKTVLVWFEYFRYGDFNRPYQTYGLGYACDGKWSGFVNGQSGWKDLKILAWMPLPEYDGEAINNDNR